MRYCLSRHAQNELVNRQIPMFILESIMEKPQQILDVQPGKKIFQSQIAFKNGKLYLVRAIVNDQVDPIRIITVYKTSKIAKYWSFL